MENLGFYFFKASPIKSRLALDSVAEDNLELLLLLCQPECWMTGVQSSVCVVLEARAIYVLGEHCAHHAAASIPTNSSAEYTGRNCTAPHPNSVSVSPVFSWHCNKAPFTGQACHQQNTCHFDFVLGKH